MQARRLQIEEFNNRKIRVSGPQHRDVKAFIQKEDKRWNITLRE
jgi:hypothetical protein